MALARSRDFSPKSGEREFISPVTLSLYLEKRIAATAILPGSIINDNDVNS